MSTDPGRHLRQRVLPQCNVTGSSRIPRHFGHVNRDVRVLWKLSGSICAAMKSSSRSASGIDDGFRLLVEYFISGMATSGVSGGLSTCILGINQ